MSLVTLFLILCYYCNAWCNFDYEKSCDWEVWLWSEGGLCLKVWLDDV